MPQVAEPGVRIWKGRRRSLEGDQTSVGRTVWRLNIEPRRFQLGVMLKSRTGRAENAPASASFDTAAASARMGQRRQAVSRSPAKLVEQGR